MAHVNTVIVGLGAGLLPMSLHGCLPFLDIEVVELDAVILDLAKNYFGFIADGNLKVHIADGIQFIQGASSAESSVSDLKTDPANEYAELPKRVGTKSLLSGESCFGFRILIVDADASDVSSGLTCPPAEFLEEPFLLSVREFVGEGGLFVINLVFNHLFSLELEEDVNEVIFALPSATCIHVDKFPEVAVQFQGLLKFNCPESFNIVQAN
ncbi:hypothetical protein Taro_008871 [Colocasia esculenta]|uniref:Uncharacterized protein n=1 Tax=Colocasia esculenta TaxID=4460 RepID=A0A843TYT9_COLES|nr:hypothetical protein [Colocasia esculenta]